LTSPESDDRRAGGGDDVPELDPQFAEALREAAGKPAGKASPEESAGDPGETVEYAPGEAPDGQPTDPEPGPEPEPEPDPEPQRDPEPGPETDPEEDQGEPESEEEEARNPEQQQAEPTLISHRGRAEARAAIAAAARSGEPWAPVRPPLSGDPEPAPRRKRLWLRFVLGGFLIVGAFAAATATAGILEVVKITDDIQPIEGIQEQLAEVDGGAAQTFLILGSDRRASSGSDDRGRSDTTILLRIDPDRNIIAMLNIPRDLKVDIPDYGTGKFNEAYAYGGPKLTLRTIKRLTRGMGVQINHLVNVDFLGFAQAINALDCVYIDVDRRYYHSNAGLPVELQYDEINLQPGYQRLCGEDALDYARYRHTDTDLVRAARQQDFLREARQRVPATRLFTDRDELVDIFTEHTQSDITSWQTMVEVLRLLIEARGAPIREIRFPARLGPSYVYATRAEIKPAIEQFLGFEVQGGPRGSLDEVNADDAGNEDSTEPKRRPKRQQGGSSDAPESDGLVDAHEFSRQMAGKITRRVGGDFPVFYPRRLPSGTIYDQVPRVYHLNDTSGNAHGAYKIVLTVNLPDGTHYFGVEGIRDWGDPPILKNPSETRDIDGRDYDIYVTGDRIRLVAWEEDGNSYWVSNSLLRTLTNDQMIGMAKAMGEITPTPKPGRAKRKR